MSIFQDFIPADQDAGAQGNGKFMDFVPPAQVVEAPVEEVESLPPSEPTLEDLSKKQLLEIAAELGITDKESLKNKTTLAEAIRAKRDEAVEPLAAVPAEEPAPVDPEVVEAPVVASLSDAPVEDETSIIQ